MLARADLVKLSLEKCLENEISLPPFFVIFTSFHSFAE